MTIDDIQKLADWSAPRRVETKHGARLLRTANPVPKGPFWALWKEHKETLKEVGVTVGKGQNGQWEVCWWLTEAGELSLRPQTGQEPPRIIANFIAQLDSHLDARLQAVAGRLLPYQIAPCRQLLGALVANDGALDASATGVGKTYIAIAAAVVLQRPLFVVCPKAVIPSWKRAAAHFGIEIEVCNYELLRRGNEPACRIVRDEKDPRKESIEWMLRPETILAFDECHRLKDPRTWNCELGLAALRQRYMTLGISATAADNPLQMKFVGMLCRLFARERDFWGWATANGCAKGRFGFQFVGNRNTLARLHHEIFPAHGSRVRIEDLGDQFPETQLTAECYDVNGAGAKIDRVYTEMRDEIDALEAKEKDDTTKRACILTAILRARQRAEVLKVPACAEMIQDALDEGLSVAVFVNFDDTIDALGRLLKTDCVVRGGQSAAVRQQNIDRFQAVLAPRLAVHFPTWSAQDAKQAFGRVHRAVDKNNPPNPPKVANPSRVILCNIRAGGVGISLHDLAGSKSIQRIYFAAGTIEEQVCRAAQEKMARIDLLNDGDLALPGERRSGIEAPAAPAPVSPPAPVESAAEKLARIQMTTSADSAPTPKSKKEKPEVRYTDEQIQCIHTGLRILASMDPDKARDKNDAGFSAYDGQFGHSLAEQDQLSERQVAHGFRLVSKYRRQLPPHILEPLGITAKPRKK